jgi:hypothetical protein
MGERNKMNITQEQLKEMQKTRLHFCIPCYGGMVNEAFFISMLKFMAAANKLGLNFTVDTMVNESLIPRGRNSLVAKFLAFEPKSTHLMFVDADIGFEPEEIIKLLLANKDVSGGLYPKKALPIQYVVNKIPNSEKDPNNPNLVEVANLGTGFMLIKREVIEKIIMARPDLHYADAIGLDSKYDAYKYALFDTSIDEVTREYLSEDYHFCKLWRSMGGKIWADLTIRLDHTGYYKFSGDATKLASSL